jgi:hypothetical protein
VFLVRQLITHKVLLGATLAASVMLWPADSHAQAARRTPPHGGAVVGGGHYSRPVVVAPYYRSYYYRPYFYDPFFWGSYGWGWGWGFGAAYNYGWGWGPYGYGYPGYGYGYPGWGYGYGGYSEARILVEPKEVSKQAKVYVDGFYAGVVDDFDGWSQRLDVPPGQHEVTVYLEGYKSIHERVLFQPRETVKIKGTLERLPPGAPPEAPPQPPPPPPRPQQQGNYSAPGQNSGPIQSGQPVPYGQYGRSRRAPQQPQQPEPQAQAEARVGDASDFGTVSIRVQPHDAEIYVDGERWQTSDDQQGFSIQLAPGRHRVEVKKSGYRTFTAEVDVQPGELTPVNVSLLGGHEIE